MPFLKGKKIARELDAIMAAAEGVGSEASREAIKEAVHEMQKMNSYLNEIELLLSGLSA